MDRLPKQGLFCRPAYHVSTPIVYPEVFSVNQRLFTKNPKRRCFLREGVEGEFSSGFSLSNYDYDSPEYELAANFAHSSPRPWVYVQGTATRQLNTLVYWSLFLDVEFPIVDILGVKVLDVNTDDKTVDIVTQLYANGPIDQRAVKHFQASFAPLLRRHQKSNKTAASVN